MQVAFGVDILTRNGQTPTLSVTISSQPLAGEVSFGDWLEDYGAAFEQLFPCEKTSEAEGDVAGNAGRHITWLCSTGPGAMWIAEEAMAPYEGRVYVIRVSGPDRGNMGGPTHAEVLDDWIGRMALLGDD